MTKEPIEILGEYLADPIAVGMGGINLRAALGGNYTSTPVAPAGWKNTQVCIVYHEETGSSHITDAKREANVLFKCYGGSASYKAANAVRQNLYGYLHNARGVQTASGKIVLAEEIMRFQGPPEPDTGWPVAIAKYRITTE